ncbi:Protein RTF2-like [Acipenser ruthenus]|uniref:Protein RTF2-like n=1 Tax=Acipenser ruthenus TaxID=7906 RepID=A0A444UXV0_ACIRT|nr:Protein RTF2-like [Acipenser ruthenus]
MQLPTIIINFSKDLSARLNDGSPRLIGEQSSQNNNPGPSKTTKNELKTATVNKAEDSIASAPEPSTSTAVSIKPVAAAGSKRLFSGRDEKSETYKSLFTSHSSAKRTKDQTSNWVTHTPYHF